MSDQNTEVTSSLEELTDAELENVAGGNKAATQTATATSGKPVIHDFTFTKKVDIASSHLF